MRRESLLRVCQIFLLLLLFDIAQAATFQLKGVSLGAPASVACGTSKVTDNLGEIIRKNKAEVPSLVDMETNECEVEHTTFGGNRVASPAKLLFFNDALIVFKIELDKLPLSNFVDIYNAFVEDYGKPQRSISRPFVTDTWKRGGETLILERLGREWDDNDVTIILRKDAEYRIFEARMKANSIELKKLDAKKTKKEIR